MPRLLLTFVVALAAVVLAAPVASGAVTRKKSIWGPVEVGGVSQFPIYAELGAGLYQSHLNWSRIAPTRPTDPRNPADPAYRWPSEIDRAVQEGRKHGISVSLAVLGSPEWSNGGRSERWAPTQPKYLADFFEAASRRYPQVRHWMVWIEPTKSDNFLPLTADGGRRLRGRGLRGPRIYARMLDASYAALKRVSRRNIVIGGNTFTVGTVRPRRWIQALRLPNGKPPRMDLFGHNPFSVRKPRLSAPPLGRGYADFSDLENLAGWVDHNLRRRGGPRHLRLFLSEFSLPTGHSNVDFNFFLTERTQASWLAAALRITRRYSRIYTLGYLGLYDDPLRPEGDQVERGLVDRSGRRKPAFDVFRRG